MDRLFFDLETTADPQAEQFYEYSGSSPSPREALQAERRSGEAPRVLFPGSGEGLGVRSSSRSAALDPDLATITALSYRPTYSSPTTALLVGDPSFPTEASLIRCFWDLFQASAGRAVGYNILSFDLPFLLRRSFSLGIKPRVLPVLARYRVDPITDLYAVLYNWGPGKGLKWVAARYGLETACPGLTGSLVPEMDRDTLRLYAKNDVDLVAQLYARMKGIYFQ